MADRQVCWIIPRLAQVDLFVQTIQDNLRAQVAELERRERSKSLAVARRGGWVAGKDLEIVLQQLFGTR